LVEQRLDLFLFGVRQLAASVREEFEAVVLGRVVRGGDDSSMVLAQECDRRRGKDAPTNDFRSGADKAFDERGLNLRT
jgi:hypothetical protein